MTLTKEEIKEIVARAYSGETEYEKLRETNPFGVEMPPWSELTEEQKANVKKEQMRYAREMRELGESLRNEKTDM
jgi:hypothetical protein